MEWGLLGPREVDRLWERHLLNSAVVEQLVPADASVLDLGSGAGLPGIPLRLARPDLRVTLVEPMARRMRFLTRCRQELDLPDVTLAAARAEEVDEPAAVVTARALAPLPRLLGWGWPLVASGGALLAVKGAHAAAELAAAEAALPPDLDGHPQVVFCSLGGGDPLATVVRLRRRTSAARGGSGRRADGTGAGVAGSGRRPRSSRVARDPGRRSPG